SHEDDVQMRNVAVLGADVAERLFPLQEPVGKVVRLGSACSSFVVVGVLRKQDDPPGRLSAHDVYVPLRMCRARFGETIINRLSGRWNAERVPLSEILVAAKSPKQVGFVSECIAALLEEAHLHKDYGIYASPIRR